MYIYLHNILLIRKTYHPKDMITLFILFVVIQSQITGGFTLIESNEVQHEDNVFEKKFFSSLLKIFREKLGQYLSDGKIPEEDKNCYISIMGMGIFCKTINGNDKKTKYEGIQKEKNNESDSSRRVASATNKIHSDDSLTVPRTQADDKHGSLQDIPSQSTESSIHLIEDDEKMSEKNDDSRGKTIRRILLIILSSIVLVTFGIVCIVGAHWFTYDKLTRRDRRRTARDDGHAGHGLRSPTVVTVSSSYHRLGLDDDRVRTTARDCPSCAVRSDDNPCTYDEAVGTEDASTTTTTIKNKSPPPLDDPPPPSYDECMSFVHTRPRTRDLPTNEMTTYWYTSV